MSLRFPTVCSGTLTLVFAVTAISGFSIGDKATKLDQVTLQNQLVQIASEAKEKSRSRRYGLGNWRYGFA
jgi:hypothetical protein